MLAFVTVSEERFSCGISAMATPIDYCFEISASDHIKTYYRWAASTKFINGPHAEQITETLAL